MNCTACGVENPDHAKFCLECGVRFAQGCTSCGTELPAGAKFCLECGTPVATGLNSAPSAADRVPRDYTPKHLAEKILRSKSVLEGERKQVTVLFADVKGSMELAEEAGPEEWHRTLDRFFQILTDGVHRFEGTVNQYTGDGIMALFGAPIAHEDHAHRACYASLHLREELREFAREVKRRHGLDFAVRLGLNSGEVIVGKIGDDLRMDYTAQGATVGLAQRMEALASGGSVYLGAATAALVREYFDLEDLGEFDVKGVSSPLRVFELSGVGDVRTRFDVSRSRGLSSFVGRTDEMSLLETALDQARAGPGRTIGVVAQAGTGKSRLCYEFVEACRARGQSVYEARGLAHGRQLPMLPMLELMRDFFGIDERDSDRVVREKIAGRSLLLDSSLQSELPILFDLLGVPDPARPSPEADPDALQRRMYEAIRTLVRADGDTEPGSVLLVEDLHWLDPASDALLEQIVEANVTTKTLVVVNFRPEYHARWMKQSYYQQLSLLPLSEDALRDLLGSLLGNDPSVASLPAAIYGRTGGNPFFIEEVVRSLIDEGHLEGSEGAYRLVTQVAKLPIPESVQSLLAARIDRLPEAAKQVLQAAAVIGKNFRESILARVANVPDAELREALRTLQDAEFVYEAALYPEREHSFNHPLTQEVAAQSQLSERQMRVHGAVARAYEEIDAERLDERAALLAHHWEHAGELARAAKWHARAAGRIGLTDFGEAYRHWCRVDDLLQRAPDGVEEGLQAQVYSERLSRAFRVGIADDEAAAIFERGRAFLETRGDAWSLARLTCAYAGVVQTAGRLVEYLELAERAVEIARGVGDRELLAGVGLDRVYALFLHGSLVEAVEWADEIVNLVGDDPELGADILGYSPLITNLAFASMPLAFMGRLDEAEQRLQRAQRLAKEQNRHETLSWLGYVAVEVALARGDTQAALGAARRACEMAERSGSVFDSAGSGCWLSVAQVEAGDFEAAAATYEAASVESRKNETGRDFVISCAWVAAAAQLGLGEVEKARELADRAVALCEEQQLGPYLCRAYIARAAVRRAHPDCDDATVAADLDLTDRLADQMQARLFKAALLEQRGQLEEALRRYEEIGATGHAKRVAQVLRNA